MASVATHPALPRISDLAGRPRGSATPVDIHGTLITSHEAVDGLSRLVVHPAESSSVIVPASAVTALPEWNLALVHLPRPVGTPLLVGDGRLITPGDTLRVRLGGEWCTTAVTGTGPATYTATDRFHTLPEALTLALPPGTAVPLRLNAEATGGPVLDDGTGAVVAVLVTAVHTGRQAAGFAVPLRAAAARAPGGALDTLLRRNAATVPGLGSALNLAGVLRLTACAPPAGGDAAFPGPEAGSARPGVPDGDPPRAARPEAVAALRAFDRSDARVLALVGPPGTGRGASLAAYAASRAGGPAPSPTLQLRGADLQGDDRSLRDAVHRQLTAAAGRLDSQVPGAAAPCPTSDPDVAARTARDAGHPLLVVLGAPEEMPPALAADLPHWCARTAAWLRATGARLALACRPEYWERAGTLFAPDTLFAPPRSARAPGVPLPACQRLGDLPPEAAARARAALGVGDGIAPGDEAHPLALRMLATVRAAQPAGAGGRPDREEIFAAHLDLVALRVAERTTAASDGPRTPRAVRRLAATAAGRLHEAARCSVGPVLMSQRAFDALFPHRGGWARAVLDEGVLRPAGRAYRFADEEFADWLHARHLDLDAALDRLLGPAPAGSPAHDPTGVRPGPPPVAPPPIPRHRIGPVVFALLRLGRERGPDALRRRLQRMVDVLPPGPVVGPPSAPDAGPPDAGPSGAGPSGAGPPDAGPSGAGPLDTGPSGAGPPDVGPPDGWSAGRLVSPPDGWTRALPTAGPAPCDDHRAHAPQWEPQSEDDACWWACHLLGEVLLRLPDATRQTGIARQLAERVGACAVPAERFGGWFWAQLALPTAHRVELLRLLLPADPPRAAVDRYLTTAGRLLAAEPRTVQPLLCRWFDDQRPLAAHGGTTVAAAAQALLHTHRGTAVDQLTDTLIDAAHPRANELLDELVDDEPAALCRAVLRWAADDRPIRRAAAAAHVARLQPRAPHAVARAQLVRAAELLLARPTDTALHGDAYRVLLGDPAARHRHLRAALRRLTGPAGLPPTLDADDRVLLSAVTSALVTHPRPVLAALRSRLAAADRDPAAATVLLETLAGVTGPPAVTRRIAHLVQELAHRAPLTAAGPVATFVRLRLRQGPAARAVLHPLVGSLLRHGRPGQRAALGPPLVRHADATHGGLLDLWLHVERDPCVLVEVLDAAVRAGADEHLVGRLARLLSRTPDGRHALDRRLAGLASTLPAFRTRLQSWWDAAPERWAVLAGAGTRRVLCRPTPDGARDSHPAAR